VLLKGESGTGKEVAARYLHARSERARGPFVAVNCGALPAGLVESELFGHKKGAFTGAAADHPGRFRQAHGGTLFLDEIGDMPLEAQVRLLRALQERRVCPVGDTREYAVDFRLVCATHRDLAGLARAGRFREDLLFRLDVVSIALPPLRDRRGDIPLLLRHFLASLLPADEAESAWRAAPADFADRPFAGNVRELRNLAERYCVYRELGEGWNSVLGDRKEENVSETLPPGAEGSPMPHPGPARPRSSRVSCEEIARALAACGHHRGRASRMLGISRRALQYRIAKMGRAVPP
jgi:DNA-binding NtrC family response regulator